MFEFPIQYDTPVFRPPGEANSLILNIIIYEYRMKQSFSFIILQS